MKYPKTRKYHTRSVWLSDRVTLTGSVLADTLWIVDPFIELIRSPSTQAQEKMWKLRGWSCRDESEGDHWRTTNLPQLSQPLYHPSVFLAGQLLQIVWHLAWCKFILGMEKHPPTPHQSINGQLPGSKTPPNNPQHLLAPYLSWRSWDAAAQWGVVWSKTWKHACSYVPLSQTRALSSAHQTTSDVPCVTLLRGEVGRVKITHRRRETGNNPQQYRHEVLEYGVWFVEEKRRPWSSIPDPGGAFLLSWRQNLTVLSWLGQSVMLQRIRTTQMQNRTSKVE